MYKFRTKIQIIYGQSNLNLNKTQIDEIRLFKNIN